MPHWFGTADILEVLVGAGVVGVIAGGAEDTKVPGAGRLCGPGKRRVLLDEIGGRVVGANVVPVIGSGRADAVHRRPVFEDEWAIAGAGVKAAAAIVAGVAVDLQQAVVVHGLRIQPPHEQRAWRPRLPSPAARRSVLDG